MARQLDAAAGWAGRTGWERADDLSTDPLGPARGVVPAPAAGRAPTAAASIRAATTSVLTVNLVDSASERERVIAALAAANAIRHQESQPIEDAIVLLADTLDEAVAATDTITNACAIAGQASGRSCILKDVRATAARPGPCSLAQQARCANPARQPRRPSATLDA